MVGPAWRRSLWPRLRAASRTDVIRVAEEGQQLVNDGARALTCRNLTEGLCRYVAQVRGLVAEEGSNFSMTAPAR